MQRLNNTFPFIFVWLWSTGFIGAKYGLPYIEPHFMLTIRFACAIGLLFLLARLFRERRLSTPEKGGQMLVGMLLHGAYLGGVFYAIKSGMSAGIVAIIVGLQPLVTALFSRFWLAQGLQGLQKLGMCIGFAGTLLVIAGSGKIGEGAVNLGGLTACIIALLGISAGSILQKRAGQGLPLLGGATYQYVGAIAVVFALSMVTETQSVTVTPQLVMAMSWLVLGLSVSALLLLMVVIRAGEIAQVASYFYLVPPATVLQAWILFGERLGGLSIAGCLITVLGVYLVISTDGLGKKIANWLQAPAASKISEGA
ncbi:DMT family transporter [Leisingera sp. ANG59]|uniref:DMT family transporter n=1 Tax=Leisingera sp. ANG59 TaxID=2675221 RepID=UPI001572C3D0|nr:EamA family transporter [Leisingera sp. ANG59]NSY39772.1 EamA family transporter [Leisingera sp. ANG59]